MANVKMYTTPTCVYCKMTKEFFAKNNVTFSEVNVAEDEAALKEMYEKSHQMGVPVIDVDGSIFIGFDKKGLSQALHIQ